MKCKLRLFFAISLLLCGASHADSLLVVTSNTSNISALSESQLRQLFLCRLFEINGEALQIANHNDGAKLREEFYPRATRMSWVRAQTKCSAKVFAGEIKSFPDVFSDTSELTRWLTESPGRLSYIREDQVSGDLKVIFRVDQ